MCPDFGIGEALAATGLFASEEAGIGAGLGALAGEAAGAAGVGEAVGGLTAEGLPFLTGEAASTALPQILVNAPLGTTAAGAGEVAGTALGAGGLLSLLQPTGAGPMPFTPPGTPAPPLGTTGADFTPPLQPAPLGTTAPGTPAGVDASAFSAPAGLDTPLGVDPTSAFAQATPGPGSQPPWDTTPVSTPGGNAVPNLPPAQNVNDLATNPAYNPTSTTPEAPLGANTTPTATPTPATSTATPTATPAAAPAQPQGFFDKMLTGAENSFFKNPIGIGLGAAGLGYSILSGQQMSEAQKKMKEQAATLNEQGQKLVSYLTSGTLPDGLKKMLDQATASAKAKIRQNYASQGMNADPAKNSQLAQQLALVDQEAVISTARIGQQLATTGVQESGLASNLYTSLANLDMTQTGNIGKAIAAMAAAFNTGGGLKLQVG